MAAVSLPEIKAATDRWATEPAAAVADLAKLLKRAGDEVDSALPVLEQLIPHKEWHERLKHRQLPYHGASLDELFFRYAKAELREYLRLTEKAITGPSVTVPSVMHRCMALFAANQWGAVDQLLAHINPMLGRHIWTNVTFKSGVYEALERMSDMDIAASFPPVEYGAVPEQLGPVIYLACDYQYYLQFARPLLRSLGAHRPGAAVHLHLMDTTSPQREEAHAFTAQLGLAVSSSSEEMNPRDRADIMTARGYFHAARFVRLLQHIQRYPRELWLLDVDGLINRDPAELFKVRGTADVALRVRPGRFEPWNQFNAAVVGVAPTEKALGYLRLIAAYIAHFYGKNMLGWGIDQLAMFAVFQWLKESGQQPTVALLDDRAVDYEYRDDSVVWCNSGRAKIALTEAVDPASPRARFDRAFQRYATS